MDIWKTETANQIGSEKNADLQPQAVSRERAEAVLRQYPEGKPAEKAAVDAFLAEFIRDPYIDAIRLFYFDGLTNAQVAERLYCVDTTCRRNRSRLVREFAARLADPASPKKE